jgi:hypothetical protein
MVVIDIRVPVGDKILFDEGDRLGVDFKIDGYIFEEECKIFQVYL